MRLAVMDCGICNGDLARMVIDPLSRGFVELRQKPILAEYRLFSDRQSLVLTGFFISAVSAALCNGLNRQTHKKTGYVNNRADRLATVSQRIAQDTDIWVTVSNRVAHYVDNRLKAGYEVDMSHVTLRGVLRKAIGTGEILEPSLNSTVAA